MEHPVASLLAKKRVSKKINYEAVASLGAEDDQDALPPELEAMINVQQQQQSASAGAGASSRR